MNWFSVSQPAIFLNNLRSISNLIVQYVDIELQLIVNTVPVSDDFFFIRAEP